MRAQFFAQQQAQIKQKMRAIRTRYSGRSGRYSRADTDEMARLGDALSRAQRFISPGDADPDAVSGKRGQNPADSIAQNAHHHGAIPPLPRGKPVGLGASGGGGDGHRVEAIDDDALEEHGGGGAGGGGGGGAVNQSLYPIFKQGVKPSNNAISTGRRIENERTASRVTERKERRSRRSGRRPKQRRRRKPRPARQRRRRKRRRKRRKKRRARRGSGAPAVVEAEKEKARGAVKKADGDRDDDCARRAFGQKMTMSRKTA